MNRSDYYAAYRNARAAYSFFTRIRGKLPRDKLPEFLLTAADACPNYDFTRLHGDILGFMNWRKTHRYRRIFRLPHLRQRVRLP